MEKLRTAAQQPLTQRPYHRSRKEVGRIFLINQDVATLSFALQLQILTFHLYFSSTSQSVFDGLSSPACSERRHDA